MAGREHLLDFLLRAKSEKGGEIAEMTFYYSPFALYGRQRRRAQSVEFFLGLDDSLLEERDGGAMTNATEIFRK